jgi:hypothetical protein
MLYKAYTTVTQCMEHIERHNYHVEQLEMVQTLNSEPKTRKTKSETLRPQNSDGPTQDPTILISTTTSPNP